MVNTQCPTAVPPQRGGQRGAPRVAAVVLEMVGLEGAFGAAADNFSASRYNVSFPPGFARSVGLGRCPNCQFVRFETNSCLQVEEEVTTDSPPSDAGGVLEE